MSTSPKPTIATSRGTFSSAIAQRRQRAHGDLVAAALNGGEREASVQRARNGVAARRVPEREVEDQARVETVRLAQRGRVSAKPLGADRRALDASDVRNAAVALGDEVLDRSPAAARSSCTIDATP
jgi:hypothetical protein